MAGLQTSVRYASDGTSAVWHVPFPFASPADVGVKLIAADGQERRLSQGADYVINGSAVMCVVPSGCSIAIWLDAPIDAALAASRSAAMRQDTEMGGMPLVMPTASAQDAALAQTLARIADSLDAQAQRQKAAEDDARARLAAEADALLELSRESAKAAAVSSVSAEAAAQTESLRQTAATLTAGLHTQADAATQKAAAALEQATQAGKRLDDAAASINAAFVSLSEAAERGSNDVRGAANVATLAVRQAQSTALAHIGAAVQRAVNVARISSGTGNAEALLVPDSLIPAGTEIRLPGGLSYQPGRGMLLAFYQGCALALGHNFLEVGCDCETSDRARLLFDVQPGDEVLFRVIATNSRAELEAVTQRAESAADEAEGFAKEAEASAGKAEQAQKKAEDAQWYAEKWAENAAISADQSHGSAQCAWDAAYQATIAAQPERPGIAVVKEADDLDGALSGAYLLNPFLRHSPTHFMGMWPVQAGDEAVWDGVFFLGQAYPDTPMPPPMPICTQKPQKPEDPTAPPEGGDNGDGGASSAVWGPCRK